MKKIIHNWKRAYISVMLSLLVILCGCTKGGDTEQEVNVTKNNSVSKRSNEAVCLIPTPDGDKTIGTDELIIDVSNSENGYFYIIYSGDNEDIKLQLSCDDGITYTYKIIKEQTVVPLTEGSGTYEIIVYEGMGNGQYSVMFTEKTDVQLKDDYSSYLYPNCYVEFTKDSQAVAIGRELAKDCTSDLEVIASVYEYVVQNISYDYEKAENIQTNYVPDIDVILNEKKGICFDYASLMAAMLRSQRIPTRLEIGYAGDAYHAWVTTYVEDIGWINGIIQFDGADWTLMDPTFAANSDTKSLKNFIGSGDNYFTKYVY